MEEMRPSHDWIAEILEEIDAALAENAAFWAEFKPC